MRFISGSGIGADGNSRSSVPENIYNLLNAEPEVIEIGLPFMRIMFGTNAVIVFLFLLNGIFRGAATQR